MIKLLRPSPDALFRPGDLVRHRRYGYRGVIVAADATCKASDGWYQSNQTQPTREQPWYHVLVHQRMHSTYAAQSSLEADSQPGVILHPLVGLFFHGFEDGRYERNDEPWGL